MSRSASSLESEHENDEATRNAPRPDSPVVNSTDGQDRDGPHPQDIPRIDYDRGLSWPQLSLHVLAVLAVMTAAYFARAILFPIALAIVLFFLLAPLVRLLSRRLMPEWLAASVVVLSLSATFGVAAYVLSGPVTQWFSAAPKTFRQAEQKLRFMVAPVDKIDEATEEVKKIASGSDQETIEVTIKQPPITNYILSATLNFLAGVCITIVLVYLLLSMGHRTLNSVVELIPTMTDKRGFVEMIRNVERGISSYLLTITTINTLLGVIIGGVLAMVGMPDPLLLGMMAGLLNFIPFAGCFIGATVTFLIGIVYLDTPMQALLGPTLYLAINILEGNLITPLVLGRSMKLNPAVVFLFIVFWGWIWGVGGILIAVPMLGMFKIICDHFQKLKPIGRILSG